ncbi:hypothetical protein AGMMS4956_00710 [Bacteroidia bacterium]|nr:hypothetical protein AGMMS4956_00710 [Bacteroidia bacterium]
MWYYLYRRLKPTVNKMLYLRDKNTVGESVPHRVGDFPQQGKVCHAAWGTFPDGGKRVTWCGELSPMGENVSRGVGNFPPRFLATLEMTVGFCWKV